MKRQPRPNIGIQLGASVEAIEEMTSSIMKILEAKCDQKTMRVALNTLSKGCQTTHNSVSGCSINMDGDS